MSVCLYCKILKLWCTLLRVFLSIEWLIKSSFVDMYCNILSTLRIPLLCWLAWYTYINKTDLIHLKLNLGVEIFCYTWSAGVVSNSKLSTFTWLSTTGYFLFSYLLSYSQKSLKPWNVLNTWTTTGNLPMNYSKLFIILIFDVYQEAHIVVFSLVLPTHIKDLNEW